MFLNRLLHYHSCSLLLVIAGKGSLRVECCLNVNRVLCYYSCSLLRVVAGKVHKAMLFIVGGLPRQPEHKYIIKFKLRSSKLVLSLVP